MRVRDYIVFLLMISLSSFVVGCNQKGAETSDKGTAETSAQYSGADAAGIRLIDFIKKSKLANFQSSTIGGAFDSYSYFTKKEWKAEQLKSGHFTIDFLGWSDPAEINDEDINNGVTGKGLEVKFVVEPDGRFYVFMVSKIESGPDGKTRRTQITDSAGVLESLYANRKINF